MLVYMGVGFFSQNWCFGLQLLIELWRFHSSEKLEAVVFFCNHVGGWLCSSLGVMIVNGGFVLKAIGVFLFCVGMAFGLWLFLCFDISVLFLVLLS